MIKPFQAPHHVPDEIEVTKFSTKSSTSTVQSTQFTMPKQTNIIRPIGQKETQILTDKTYEKFKSNEIHPTADSELYTLNKRQTFHPANKTPFNSKSISSENSNNFYEEQSTYGLPGQKKAIGNNRIAPINDNFEEDGGSSFSVKEVKVPIIDSDNASIWTTANDKSISHLNFPKTQSDEYSLPAGWAKVYSNSQEKFFFANGKLKTTTWVDPRDEYWKKSSWEECDFVTNETPYGWEICVDPDVGLYFIDHINHRNTLDDPRRDTFKVQFNDLKNFLLVDCNQLILNKEQELHDKRSHVEHYERLLRNFNKNSVSPEVDNRNNESKEFQELRCMFYKLQNEEGILELALLDLFKDVDELEELSIRIGKNDELDQVKGQRLIHKEIVEIKQKYMQQVDIKIGFEAEIKRLKEIDETTLYLPPKPFVVKEGKASFNSFVDKNDEVIPLTKKSRLERELGLLELKKQLRSILRHNEKLSEVVNLARSEVERFVNEKRPLVEGIIGPWVITINEKTPNNIFSGGETKLEKAAPLSFREKVFILISTSQGVWTNFTV